MTFITYSSLKRGIAYYRHSAEDKQENSVAIQREHAEKFARENGIEIIHEEADEGKSGLSANRAGFQRILTEWVFNDSAPSFDYILVYDVSRWGRFQNPDESAMYEYQCTKRGKKILFIDKGMPREDQALINHLQTSIERYMAADYSRQLSNKVFFGAAKVSEQGYSAGGMPSYGMARLLLDVNKQPIRILKYGEHKQISNERVTFTPLYDETTQTVGDIYSFFTVGLKSPSEVAAILNKRKTPSPTGGLWDKDKIIRILSNETYIGTRVYNKTWKRLKEKSRRNPRSDWVVCTNAFEAVVTRESFELAQQLLRRSYFRLKPTGTAFIRKKLRRTILNDISTLLVERGNNENQINYILQNFPVVFSTKFLKMDILNWCFSIQEKMRQHDSVLAVSIDANKEDYIDDVFCIPIRYFSSNNFLVFSQQESHYSEFQISGKAIEERAQLIIDGFNKELPGLFLSGAH